MYAGRAGTSRSPIPLKCGRIPARVEIIHRHCLVVARRLHRRSCAPRREDRVGESWTFATEKLFTYGKGGACPSGEETADGAVSAHPTGCIMQRLFKVRPIRPLSSPRFASLSLPPLLRTLSPRRMRRLHRRRNATRACTVVVKISRGYFAVQRETFHGEVDWLFGFAEPREELFARAGKRETMPGRSFALLPRWKDGNRITLIIAEIIKKLRLLFYYTPRFLPLRFFFACFPRSVFRSYLLSLYYNCDYTWILIF